MDKVTRQCPQNTTDVSQLLFVLYKDYCETHRADKDCFATDRMDFRQLLCVLHKDCCETDNTDFSKLLCVVCNDCYRTDCACIS